MKKAFFRIFLFFVGLYVLVVYYVYASQEDFIFFPTKLSKNYKFEYNQKFEEVNLKAKDGNTINGLFFPAENPKGVVYFLHGNADNLSSWGNVSELYLSLNYSVFLIDYRGFGKSQGHIESEKQIIDDAQLGYNFLKKRFAENQIIVMGYSIGTGVASALSSRNHPKSLMLLAPYYSLKYEMETRYSILPTFILKYNFENFKNIKKTKCSVYIFHGKEDHLLSYSKSLQLKKYFKKGDVFIPIPNQGHNFINDNPDFQEKISLILK